MNIEDLVYLPFTETPPISDGRLSPTWPGRRRVGAGSTTTSELQLHLELVALPSHLNAKLSNFYAPSLTQPPFLYQTSNKVLDLVLTKPTIHLYSTHATPFQRAGSFPVTVERGHAILKSLVGGR